MAIKNIATNKKAYHDYFIEDTLEAGVELVGSEVKSVRRGTVNLKDSFALVRDNQIFLIGMHISVYEKGSYFNPDPKRERRLLLKKAEILKLKAKTEQKGYTLVPTRIYLKDALVKIELGVAKGKELHDKRRAIKEKEQKREMERAIKESY
ncbi:MAG: SsrA-binding protein SmpB [Christensenellales bacterium]